MSIITVGIDLAKNVFAVHGVDEAGRAALVKPKVSREQLLALIVQLPPAAQGCRQQGALEDKHGYLRC